jgi:serine/threonine-protein kinase RsbW
VSRDTVPLRLSLPADSGSLLGVRRTVERWLADAGAERVDDLVLAVNEAVANAVEHSGLSDTDLIGVHGDICGDRIHIEVRNRGGWKQPGHDSSRGHGLQIMRAVMDTVDVASIDDVTTVVLDRSLR